MTAATATKKTAAAKKAPAKSKSTASSIEMMMVDGRRFAAALKRVSAFASRDDTLPMINSVCIEHHDGVLTLIATDRFKLGAETVDLIKDDDADKIDDWTLQVALRDVAVILAKLRGERWHIPITLHREVPNTIPGGVTHTEIDINGVRVGFDAQFPKWRVLVKGVLAEPEATSVSVSTLYPEHLKPLLSLGRGVILRFPADPLRIVLAYIPGQFVGIVMPMRPMGDLAADITNAFGLDAAPDGGRK